MSRLPYMTSLTRLLILCLCATLCTLSATAKSFANSQGAAPAHSLQAHPLAEAQGAAPASPHTVTPPISGGDGGGLDSLGARVHLFGRSLPQEKVFVHMDNSAYFLGDTIFYKAYVTRSDRGTLSALSGVLYVELLNADGYLVERQIVQLEAGMGVGTFVLKKTPPYYSGYHELRAYTRWMLNFGRSELPHKALNEQLFLRREMAHEFYRDYDKLYSRVFPVYDAPQAPGEYFPDMTERPMQRLAGSREADTRPVVTVYPEGGNAVLGMPSRLYFEAATAEGRHVRGSLTVRDAKGETVASAPTANRGRGVVALPSVTEGMSAVFTDAEGRTVDVALPAPLPAGAVVTPELTDTHLSVAVHTNVPSPLALTVMNNGLVRHFESLNFNAGSAFVCLSLDTLPRGVLDLTVFDAEGRILADRLVFNSRHAADCQLVVEGLKDEYEPFAPISLSVRRRSPSQRTSVLSASVTDAFTSNLAADNGNILTEMLLCSEIKGFVEEPSYYFESADSVHRSHLDLLMATQGWRRFSWQVQSHPEAFVVDHLNEPRTPRLVGGVYHYTTLRKVSAFEDEQAVQVFEDMGDEDNEYADIEHIVNLQDNLRDRNTILPPDLEREVRVQASFVSPSEPVLEGDQTTVRGAFSINQPDFCGQFYMHLAAADTTKIKNLEKYAWVDARESEYPELYVRISDAFPRHPKPYSFYQTQLMSDRHDTLVTGSFDDRLMSELVVRRNRGMMRRLNREFPAVAMSAYEAFNLVCDAGVCPGYYIGGDRFAADIARVLMDCDMGVNGAWRGPDPQVPHSLWSKVPEFMMKVRYDFKEDSRKLSPDMERASGESPTKYKYRIYKAYQTSPSVAAKNELNKFNVLENIDSVFIYTDYAPRHYGNPLWDGDDQPQVVVDLRTFRDGSRQMTYRDRFYIRQGFNQCEDFYAPDYSRRRPADPKADTRRTLLWLPYVMFDSDGKVTLRAFKNGRRGPIRVTINGIDSAGTPLAN
mgnify:FL=1